MLEPIKTELCKLHLMLPKEGLVTWTSGNVSARDPATGLVVIKPSGIMYDDLRPEDHVVLDLDGNIVEGKLKPSSDTASHLYIYRHKPEVNGVVHTHSPYATAFAALGQSIPVYLTAIADEFGEEIPCAPYVDNLGDHIGEAILKYKRRAPAVLLGQHGVFAWGPTPREAVKAAVMLEDVAKTVHLALLLGKPQPLPPEEVKKWWDRYHSTYGQEKKP